MKYTLADVAALAGVSKGTVSRAMNKKGYVSNETKLKIQKAIKELNYYPNELARSVSNSKSFLIGAIIPTTMHPFFGELIFFIERKLNSLGFKLMICNSLNDMEKENRYLELLLSNQVDGMIVSSHNSNNVDYDIPGFPVVSIDYFLSKKVPIISSDNYKGGYLAAKELIDAGCEKIVSINGVIKPNNVPNKRLQAYQDLMEKRGLKSKSIALDNKLTQEEEETKIRIFLKDNPNTDGIFAQDDETAAHALKVLKSLHQKVPNDVKVVGYDGSQIARQLIPELTTIQQPIEEMANVAVDTLIKRINKENIPESNIVLPVSLIKGKTT